MVGSVPELPAALNCSVLSHLSAEAEGCRFVWVYNKTQRNCRQSLFSCLVANGYISWLRWPSWHDIRGTVNSLLDKPSLLEMNYTSLNGLNITLVDLKIHVLFPSADTVSGTPHPREIALWLKASHSNSSHLPNRDWELS